MPSLHCAGIRILVAQQGPWPNDVPAPILEPPCNDMAAWARLLAQMEAAAVHNAMPCCQRHVVRSGGRKRPARDWDRTTCCGADVPGLLPTALESGFWWLSKDRGPMTCQLPFSSPHAMHMAAWARMSVRTKAVPTPSPAVCTHQHHDRTHRAESSTSWWPALWLSSGNAITARAAPNAARGP